MINLKDYTDKFGLIQPNKGETSGNGLLYTAELLINLRRLNLLTPETEAQYLLKILECQKWSGLFNRSPENKDQEGIDDYIGVVSAFYILGRLDLAQEVLEYGQAHRFVYNNTEKSNKSSWFWRFPHVLCHFYWSAGKTPNVFLQMYWLLERLIATWTLKKENQDGILLGYLLGVVAKNRNKLINWVLNKFEDKVFNLYPGGYAEVVAAYLNNKEHPLVQYWPYSIFEHFTIHDK